MIQGASIIQGAVHGKVIELDRDLGLPDGQQVTIALRPISSPEDAIPQCAGAWADAGPELDVWLAETQRSRRKEQLAGKHSAK
jgi:hypothetical protein